MVIVPKVLRSFFEGFPELEKKKIKLVNGCRIPPNHQSWDFKSLIIGEMADNFRARKVIYYVVRYVGNSPQAKRDPDILKLKNL